MTAVSVLVQDAMFAAQVIGQDQTASSADTQLVLRRLQRMLDSWSNERQMIFANTTQTFTMTAGTASYSTSLLSTGRPITIQSMVVSLSNIDYPVNMIDQQMWNSIPYKIAQAIPNQCFYDPTFPNGTMNFYPIPYAAFTCSVDCQEPLNTGTLTLATNLTLPEGYEAAIVAGLAVDIWGSFKSGMPSQQMQEEKTQTRAILKRTNYMPLEMETPFSNNGDISNSFLYKGF